jgi:lipoprotein-anchoring transpeptidase ErfK/SrfK
MLSDTDRQPALRAVAAAALLLLATVWAMRPWQPAPAEAAAGSPQVAALVSLPSVDSEWLAVVQRGAQRLVLYHNGVEQGRYTVSTGKPETVTPLGWWKIVDKYPVSPAGIYGTRWMGWQRWNPVSGRYEWYSESPPFGMHGTNEPEKIGTAVSSGCVRLKNADVEQVYSLLPVGTYVVVVE